MGADSATLFTLAWLGLCAGATAALCVVRPALLDRWLGERRAALPVAIFAAAFVVRLVPAVALKLSPEAFVNWDLDSFRIVGHMVRSGEDVYSQPDRYPYLPAQLYISGAASWLASNAAAPFTLLVKLPAIAADAAIPLLILAWRGPYLSPRRANWAAAAYVFNPLSITVVSIHGQFDSIPLLLVLAALLPLRSRPSARRTAVIAGLLFGAAVLAKTWPLMLLPIAAWQLRNWTSRGIFVACAAIAPLAGLALYAAITGTSPNEAIDAARQYNGFRGVYGYPLALSKLANKDVLNAAALRDWADTHRMAILILGTGAATIISLRQPLSTAAATVVLAFYVFTPGWGYHYLVWALPFVLLGLPRLASATYLALTALTVFVVYYWFGGVYFGAFSYFDASSAMVRYRWLTPVPIWLWSTTALAALAASSPAWPALAARLPRVHVPAHRGRGAASPR